MAIDQKEIFGDGYTADQTKPGAYLDSNLVLTNSNLTNPPFTVNLWFKKQAAFSSSAHAFINICRTDNDLSLFEIGTGTGSPRRFRMRVQDLSSGATNTSNTSVGAAVGTWYMLTAVFEASNNRTLYVDGANPVTNTATRTTNAPNKIVIGGISSNQTLYVGTGIDPSYGVSLFAGGSTAEVAVWSAALTAAEITSLYKGARTIQVRPQSLVTYLPLVREYKQELTGRASYIGIEQNYDSDDFESALGDPIEISEPIPVVPHQIRRYG
jgi:hypothetical protein